MFPRRKFITADENFCKVTFDCSSTKRRSIFMEKSVTDEFYFEKRYNEDGSESVSVTDPIIMLFNQERLVNMGATSAKALLDSFQQKTDSLSELRKKCSDEDLVNMMKSRYLQKPSEIMAWCRYMQQNVDAFNDEVKKYAESKVSETEKETTVESSET